MIYVTVGTHEQPFNRLIEAVDNLKRDGVIKEDVIIQKGYSTYEPKYCKSFDLIPWEEVQRYNREARIIITHGGPASFIDIIALGKKPIVVPRQKKFNEHVNDHQLEFSKEVAKKGLPIIVIDDINELKEAIESFNDNEEVKFESNNKNFVNLVEDKIKKLFD